MISADVLAVPLVLVGLAVLALVHLRVAKGPLKEPSERQTNGHSNGEAQAAFEAAKDEKEVAEKDGDPIEQHRFWARSRLRKVVVGGLILLVALLRFFALGWDAITGANKGRSKAEGAKIAEDILLLLFWVSSGGRLPGSDG